MKEARILVTGVGRRVELMQAFRQAALNLGVSLKIFGADAVGTAPALAYCDYCRRVIGMREAGYIDQLVGICEEDEIDLVIPTIDTDLLVLSRGVSRFEAVGTKVLVSASDRILICRDKNSTSDFFAACGLRAPHTYSDYQAYTDPFPCFIKPKDGSSSINAFKVNDTNELKMYAGMVEDYVIQPFVSGVEYTVDVFCDFEGKPIYITPRIRSAVRAGEVLKTQIAQDKKIIDEIRQLVEEFRPVGPLTVQLIRDENTGDDYYIEINPRFGGGAPLSMKAGARSAEALLRLLAGEEVSYQEGKCDGAVYSRFDQSVCIDEGSNSRALKGVIFDLDDTLYSEIQYVRSGYKAISDAMGVDEMEKELWRSFLSNALAIDAVLEARGMLARKQECLNIYRNQMPEINLYHGVEKMLRQLKGQGVKVGIITDGRPESQRAKLEALGLMDLVDDVIITDELGGSQFRKPCDIAFRIMQTRWKLPFEQIVYVGDNAHKDFQAPRQLGMKGIWFNNGEGLYKSGASFEPCVDSISELTTILLSRI